MLTANTGIKGSARGIGSTFRGGSMLELIAHFALGCGTGVLLYYIYDLILEVKKFNNFPED
jgi:hypothetical protein